jgi:Ankyrin repeats (many copies)/Ankyrin repeat
MRTSLDSLLFAILKDDRSKVRDLLKADSNLASRSVCEAKLYQSEIFHWIYIGDTALHLAAAGYRVEIVRVLLAAGADPNAVMNHRRSGPLHYAADGYINGPAWDQKRQIKTILCLVKAGAETNAQDKNGAAPLHRAVRTRCAAAVRCLLHAGADPTLRNKSGSTPFHLAVQTTGRGGSGAKEAKAAQYRIIKTFMSLGISTGVKDGKGKSVADCAKSDWVKRMLTTSEAKAD